MQRAGGAGVIDVLTGSDVVARRVDIEAMHRLRYRVFKERLGWDVPADDGLERDEFDELDPVYFLAFDRANRLVGTWRMLPTTGPYMLQKIFPMLLGSEPAPSQPNIWEGSRFAVDCEYEGKPGLASVSRTTGEIFCAVVEFCCESGIDEVVTVYDARIARLLPRIGCRPKWRSRILRIGSTPTMAGRFDATEEVLAEIRSANRIQASVIRHAPWLPVRSAA